MRSTKAMFFNYRYHFFIVFIAISVMLLLDNILQLSMQNIRSWDSLSYVESAYGMYILHCGNAYRPMLMAFITGLPYLFGGSELHLFIFSFWLNLFCWIGFFIIEFEIIKNVVQVKTAFFYVLISIFFFSNAISVFHLLTENIFMFVVILGFYFIQKYYKTSKFLFLSVALSIFILSVLIKPGMKFFALFLIIYYIRTIYKNYQQKISFIIYVSLFLIFVQCAGIKYQFGTFTISFIDSVTYYNYLGYKAHCYEQNKVYDQKPERLSYIYLINLDLQKKVVKNDLLNQLEHNKINLLKAYLNDFIENSSTGSTNLSACKNIYITKNFYFFKQLIFAITIWQNIIFTILAILLSVIFLFRFYKTNNLVFILSLFIIYTILTSAISCSEGDRFHVVLFPFVIILLAYFFSNKKSISR